RLRVADWPSLKGTVRRPTLACLSHGNKGKRRGFQDVPPAFATTECPRSIRQADALRASALTSTANGSAAGRTPCPRKRWIRCSPQGARRVRLQPARDWDGLGSRRKTLARLRRSRQWRLPPRGARAPFRGVA